jgi:hypothetical protein
LKHFKDRADFVVENLGILSLSPEESLVYLTVRAEPELKRIGLAWKVIIFSFESL